MSSVQLSAVRESQVRRWRWTGERRFHAVFTLAILAAVVLGFSRTFILRPLFPEWAQAHSSPDGFFYFHGVLFLAWYLLLAAQPLLIAAGRLDLHRRLGRAGAVLAVAMVVVGTIAALIAAARPTGFIDVPLPPLQFLAIPASDLALFSVFVALGLATTSEPQAHKRFMLLASLSLLDAAVGRWPFPVVLSPLPVPGYSVTDVIVDLFIVAMAAWDFSMRRRVHLVTLMGGLAIVAIQPLRFLVGETDAWQAFARWAVSLLGR